MQAISSLRFVPTVPLWLLGLAAAVCVLALAPALVRRARGALLRLLCFAVVLLWLAGPRLVQETREALGDIAVLVVDRSRSMAVGAARRLVDAAAAKLAAEAAAMPGLELRTVTVPEAGHDGTRLFTALNRALADIPRSRLAGVVMLTDGAVHDVPETAPSGPAARADPGQGRGGGPAHPHRRGADLRHRRQVRDAAGGGGRPRRRTTRARPPADHPATGSSRRS